MPTVTTIPRSHPCERCDVAEAKADRLEVVEAERERFRTLAIAALKLLDDAYKLIDQKAHAWEPAQATVRAIRALVLENCDVELSVDEVRYREACRKWAERP